MRMGKKKSSAVGDVVGLTKLNIASTMGVIAMESLPDTPQVPLMAGAKRFAGSTFGLMQIVGGGSSALKSLERLGKISKPKKKRQMRKLRKG